MTSLSPSSATPFPYTSVKNLDKTIFRAYDIRGKVDTQLTADVIYTLGLALGSEMHVMQKSSIVIGRDGRLSSPELIEALRQGLMDTGTHVIDIGMVPSPVLYFASNFIPIDCAVMLTGSHNPSSHNGLKMILDGVTLAEGRIQALYNRIMLQDFHYGQGSSQARDHIIEDYIKTIQQHVHLDRRLKIVVDCGNGVAGKVAKPLFSALGCEIIELYCEVDGRFPNHHPDPSVMENLTDLIKTVKDHKADIGLAFDGDADRIGVVTPEGKAILPDRLMMLFARDILSRNPGANIVFDVKCSHHLPAVIQKHGGIPIMCATGHSIVKSRMKEMNAILAGELSGHIFFKEKWYGFDDGLYSGCRLLEILAGQSLSIDNLFAAIPDSVNTPELKIPIPEERKFAFVEALKEKGEFADGNMVTIDGIRVEFKDGWGLLRASNTTPCLIARFEADNVEALQRIQSLFKTQLLSIGKNDQLELPF